MSFLDKKIKDNIAFFDDKAIPEGHKKRFLKRLDSVRLEESKTERWGGWIKIAAVILILISASIVLIKIPFSQLGSTMVKEVTNITFGSEIQNAFAYYDALSQQKMEKIDSLAPNPAEAERIKQIAQKKMQSLDANLAAIEKEYARFPDNDRVKAALVNNKRKKNEVMDELLKQLDESNKMQTNAMPIPVPGTNQ
jgi:hypothetical protein